jgi:hypothetical protein
MKHSSLVRTHSFSLWTIGHRRYYSPMLRTAGGPAATETMVTPRVRPSLVLRNVREPAGDSAASSVAFRNSRVSFNGHGLQ